LNRHNEFQQEIAGALVIPLHLTVPMYDESSDSKVKEEGKEEEVN
jgi:hypothetical protein